MTYPKPLHNETTASCSIEDQQARTCQGTTVMKWSSDGSLTPLDQADVVRRLCKSDPNLAGTDFCAIQSPQ